MPAMAGFTLAQAQSELDNARAAHAAALTGGIRYRFGDRYLETPPLDQILASLSFWSAKVDALTVAGGAGAGMRIYGARPGG